MDTSMSPASSLHPVSPCDIKREKVPTQPSIYLFIVIFRWPKSKFLGLIMLANGQWRSTIPYRMEEKKRGSVHRERRSMRWESIKISSDIQRGIKKREREAIRNARWRVLFCCQSRDSSACHTHIELKSHENKKESKRYGGYIYYSGRRNIIYHARGCSARTAWQLKEEEEEDARQRQQSSTAALLYEETLVI